jgi:hypothetical protein
MSDYKVDADWAGKDNLASGSALKVIKGAEFQTEFDLIASAISTKWDGSGSVNINSGSIDNTVIGGDIPASGYFTNLSATGNVTLPSTTSIGDVSAEELSYVDGATSNIQEQLNDLSTSVGSIDTNNGNIAYGNTIIDVDFDTDTGDLIFDRQSGNSLIENIDGRYPEYRTGTFTPQLVGEGSFATSPLVARGSYTSLYHNGACVVSWVAITIINPDTSGVNPDANVIISSIPVEARVPVTSQNGAYDGKVDIFRGITLKSPESQVVTVWTGNIDGQLYLLDQNASAQNQLKIKDFASGSSALSMKLTLQ